MDTFPIVRRQDEEEHGHYRTKDLILRYYDDQAADKMNTWHGPKDLREPERHPNNPPEGME